MEKIKLVIAGEEYNISTDDELEYVASLGEELNAKVSGILASNPRLSITQAVVLNSLNLLDSLKKCESSAENLRGQIHAYLEDAARARTNAEIAKRESERLAKELAALKEAK